MEVFKRKKGSDPEINKFLKELQYKNDKILVKGSNNYLNQKYFSDYDLYANLVQTDSKDIFDNIMKIINKTNDNPDMYFIEMKIQKSNGEKIKFNKIDDITFDKFNKNFSNLDYIKLDYVVRVYNNLFEMSCNYFFSSEKERNSDNIVKELLESIKDLKKENNYFKILKRIFSINNFYNQNDKLVDEKTVNLISKFLNSDEYGKMYQIMGILEANKKLVENYNDKNTIKKIIINLKDLGYAPDIRIINKEIKDIYKKINNEAKNIYSQINKQ